jgi:hypothetical protein
MRIEETHANGAKIVVTGWRARRIVEGWRAAQNPKKAEPEEPKVTGTHASTDRAGKRYYESETLGAYSPIVFGFVPNEVNQGS